MKDKVILATIRGWDGVGVIGIFSNKEKALSSSVKILLEESINYEKHNIHTPINESIKDDNSSIFEITNSQEHLHLTVYTVL